MRINYIGNVTVPEEVESWTCRVDGEIGTFNQFMKKRVSALQSSSIGHRTLGCALFREDRFSGFIFTDDSEWALVSIAARMYQPKKLTIVIDRHPTRQEDISTSTDYAAWAEVGRVVATWVRGWIQKKYNVEPVAQRAGLPSYDDYK